jgi:hypothetical protein
MEVISAFRWSEEEHQFLVKACSQAHWWEGSMLGGMSSVKSYPDNPVKLSELEGDFALACHIMSQYPSEDLGKVKLMLFDAVAMMKQAEDF